ncbi:MAG: type II toxin-antitoxin system HicA family toxin [Candidatus Firestonebacteria bacterium]
MSNRLGSIKPKEFIRKLKKAGFWIDHQTGSHVILLNSKECRVVVPYHIKEMKRGLLFGLIKQAGFTVEEFQKWK